jgi:hypothetical protein
VEKKQYLFIILGFLILGVVIALIFNFSNTFSGVISSESADELNLLLADCTRAANAYSIVNSEINRNLFCCTSRDINKDNNINIGEYCARVYEKTVKGNSPAILCSSPIDYYNSYDLCDV